MVGCAKEVKEELTRVDVLMEGEKVIHVQDEFILDLMEDALERIDWETSIKTDKSSKENFIVTFYYSSEENTPKRIEGFRIWLHSKQAIIINNKGNTGIVEMKEDEVEMMENLI